MNLINQFKSRQKFLTNYKKTKHPTDDQLAYARAVTLQTIIDNPDFPEVGEFAINNSEHIRYQPIVVRRLLTIGLNSLKSLKTSPGDGKIIHEEIKSINKELTRINRFLSSPPKIISMNLFQKNKQLVKKPKISVITTSMNLAPLVEETMRSIANQDCDSFEHIVIDGASTDGSLELIKKYPNIILISEKDSGYPDAFRKGLRLARGEYVTQCCISDSYATRSWLKLCLNVLEKNEDISLVWGLSCGLSNESKMLDYSPKQKFIFEDAPQKEEMFYYWLKTGFHFPEVNLFVRKNVIDKCYPQVPWDNKQMLDWLEFTYRFQTAGYLSIHLPVLANYFHRDHTNQLGKKLDKDNWYPSMYHRYLIRNKIFRWKLILGLKSHRFKRANGKPLNIYLDRHRLINEYIISEIKKYLSPSKYIDFIKNKLNEKIVATSFQPNFR